jgi:DNA-binding response OmpR family regulator
MRVLVVEDQEKIATFTQKGLQEAGFNAEVCHHGDTAYELATTQEFDALVLDIMLPGKDGLSIVRSLRDRGISTPVILLTARNDLNERIEGLNMGADDYLTKPFYVEELVARLQALLRRSDGQTGKTILQVGDLSLDIVKREAQRAGTPIELSAREYSLLEYLIRSPGRVFSRSQISQHVWNTHFDTGTNMVDVAVARLRKKVDDGFDLKLIETVRGVGYRMKEPASDA